MFTKMHAISVGVALALPGVVWAQASTLQDLSGALVTSSSPTVIYTAREFITMDPRKPRAEALAAHKDKKSLFVTWGYHHYFHGPMSRELLNKLAPDTPMIVWHRSGHELYLNDAALKLTGIDEGVVKGLPKSAQAQVDLAKGHFFEQGAMAPAILSKVAPFVASPEKFRKGLEFTKTFYHRTGITLACKPGGFLSKPMQDAINAVYSGDDTPFNHCFIGDGKSVYAIKPNDATSLIAETRKVEGWGKGRTFYLPQQAKLFTDGAIYSQLMQMKDGYTDGHHGAWIIDPPAFDVMFQTYWDAGYQIHIHNNGDAGFDVALERRRASEGDGCAAVSSAHAHA